MASAATLRLLLAGDVMTGRGIDQVLAHPNAPDLYESYIDDARDYVRLAERENGRIEAPVSPDYIWGEALAEIARAAPDLRIVNLETAVTSHDQPWPGKGIHYRMHPANLDCLTVARVDCAVLANNHVLDWGRPGLDETLRTLKQAGVRSAGAGVDAAAAWAPAALALPADGRVLVFACALASSGVAQEWSATEKRSGVALLPDLSESTADWLAARIARQRGPGDRVLLSIHWGGNWGLPVPRAHRQFAHRLVDLGAVDLVHGHSSHHPMPVEVYRGKLLLYGCGDLINDYEGIGPQGSLRVDVACLYFATLAPDSGELQRLDIVPLQRKRLRLVAADALARGWVADAVTAGDCRLEALSDGQRLPGWTLRWRPAGRSTPPGDA